MSEERKNWTIRTVPDSFWTRIELAAANPERFRQLLKDVPKKELGDMYWQYYDLAEDIFTGEHESYMESASDGAIASLGNWIVQQGRAYYADVQANPEKTPPRKPVRGVSFLSQIISEYWERYDENIPDS